ncbi:hypothetical protein I4U23_007947 [Adineta vaga]|nr:hypothetical protein I4U23_007947 [Adineta vaga]
MSAEKKSTMSHDGNKSQEQFGITGVTTGSSGEHLATTGASALGTSGGCGDMGNEKSKIDKATAGLGQTVTTGASSPTVATDQGTR